MSHIHGKTGDALIASNLIEDCEDTWNETAVGGVALSVVTGKNGNAARASTTTIGATTLLMSEVVSLNLSTDIGVAFWVRSSVVTSAGDLRLMLDDTASVASPLENLQIPALTADTWTRVYIPYATPANLTAIISVGLYQQVDLADGTFDIDDVRSVKQATGIKSWSITYSGDVVETTDFADAGAKTFIAGGLGWTGSFDGLKDGIPLAFNSEVVLVLQESQTTGQNFIGDAFINEISSTGAVDSAIPYTYSFQGTGDLQLPTA